MDLRKYIEFIGAAVEAGDSKNRGVAVEFECPLCNAIATVIKSSYDGHLHAQCSSCKMSFFE